MQTILVTKLGALLVGATMMLYSGISNIIIDIDRISNSKNEIIQEEIEEILEDFQTYAKEYTEYTAKESEFEVTKKDIEDFIQESVDQFAYNYENNHQWNSISEKTYSHMEKELPKHIQKFINYPGSLNNKREQIIWFYINHKVFNDNFEYLIGGKNQ